MKRIFLIGFLMLAGSLSLLAQFDVSEPKTYILSGLKVEGAEFSDKDAIIAISGLVVGDEITIPGQQVSEVIKRLWGEGIFSDVQLRAENIASDKIFLVIEVTERPRISQFSFQGVSKSQANDLREKINFIRGTILTESKVQSAKRIISNFFIEKGYFNVEVEIDDEPDKILRNGVAVNIKVRKNRKVGISEIIVNGNEVNTDNKVIRKLKKIHEKNWVKFWQRSKYVPKIYEEAKAGLITFYNDNGYRDAEILSDTTYADGKDIILEIDIYEGDQYFHRDIVWSGNYRYNSELLSRVLGIKKGDVYSRTKLDSRLFGDPNGSDVSSLYLDDGYLFFNLEPVEVAVEGDSIDLEMRVQEGPQATIRKVIVEGNTKTSDFVIRRELRTAPGQKFSRSDIIRSQREILALGYFDQENLGVQPMPNQATGMVDIKYTLEERPSDQLQLQGGWGGQVRDPNTGEVIAGGFVGTVQLGFNNFSGRKIFNPNAWRPVPSGDGQKLNLAFQMNGTGYRNFSISFLEPWLGGRKPNSFGVSTSWVLFQDRNSASSFFGYRNQIFNASVDFGTRMKFPDDFFTSRTTLSYRYFDITNPSNAFPGFVGEPQAYINAITITQAISRTSVDAPIYPRSGSIISLSVEFTPPYSLFSDRTKSDYQEMPDAEKFRFLEYHKWLFSSSWFFRIVGDMVLHTKVEAGYLGYYNADLGLSPFERFFLGGTGFMGQNFQWDGRDLIPLRGYENLSLDNRENAVNGRGGGYPIYNRFLFELRQPITLNQSAPIWALAFVEAGNGYNSFRRYNPFDLKRAAGVGLRVMLPMVGMLGLDWAYGFDNQFPGDRSQFHFIFGQNL